MAANFFEIIETLSLRDSTIATFFSIFASFFSRFLKISSNSSSFAIFDILSKSFSSLLYLRSRSTKEDLSSPIFSIILLIFSLISGLAASSISKRPPSLSSFNIVSCKEVSTFLILSGGESFSFFLKKLNLLFFTSRSFFSISLNSSSVITFSSSTIIKLSQATSQAKLYIFQPS